MLSYVTDFPEFIDQLSEVNEDLITYDFLASRFIYECEQLIKRGVIKDYIVQIEQTNIMTGKMIMHESLPYLARKRLIVVCQTDDYSSNVSLNQIVVATLQSVYKNQQVTERIRRKSFMVREKLPYVDVIPLTDKLFSQIHWTRETAHYKQAVQLAHLLYAIRLLSHQEGDWRLFSVELSDKALEKLFEKFLLSFYQKEQSEYVVKAENLQWKLKGNQALLPKMKTDISFMNKRDKKCIVMDAKFYRDMFQHNFEKQSFHSHNLYQIFTYLMHQPESESLRGILIYPEYLYGKIDESYRWDEQTTIEIYSLNLNQPFRKIKDRLLLILEATSCSKNMKLVKKSKYNTK
ncbi:McrC family protein [Halolactibacillus miurensis]|nr:hypothetical protein [Halolactibacillus miurensis]